MWTWAATTGAVKTNTKRASLERAVKAAVIKQVHKFSIGKDFASIEQIDEEQVINMTNASIYSNVPPTLITKPIQTSRKQQSYQQPNEHLPLSIDESLLPTQQQPLYQHQQQQQQPKSKTTMTTTSGGSLMGSLSSHNLAQGSPFSDPKWDKIRRKIKLINKNTGVNVLSDIISDILVAKEINYANLTKGFE